MDDRFRKIFRPTKEELQEQYDFINKIIKLTYEQHGKCCATCKHEVYVQPHPYYDYTTCEYNKSLVFAYGKGDTEHCCERYIFKGYLTTKD